MHFISKGGVRGLEFHPEHLGAFRLAKREKGPCVPNALLSCNFMTFQLQLTSEDHKQANVMVYIYKDIRLNRNHNYV